LALGHIKAPLAKSLADQFRCVIALLVLSFTKYPIDVRPKMPDLSTALLFVIAAIALLLIPGPVVLYTIARSIDQGRRAGFMSVLAAGVGDFCHVLAATLGLSALLLSSALAFSLVKYAGAAYLIYLGVRTLMTRNEPAEQLVVPPQRLSRIFSQGVLVSVLNPKTALFFLAFLPQFVNPTRGAVTTQILLFGVLFVGLGICTNSLYAQLAGTAGAWLKSNRTFLRGQRYFAGGIYVALGVTTALTGDKGGS
jgi:threonine/homoserine/homoserine lactone efflux protein